MPRLYFYDTGLLCYLFDIRSPPQIRNHYAVGSIFENLIVIEVLKHYVNLAERPRQFFWRDNKGKEIDLVIEGAGKEIVIEIKAGKTRQMNAMANLEYWQKLSGSSAENSKIVYGGSGEIVNLKNGSFIPWNQFPGWLSNLQIL